jgi:integrase
MTAQIKYAYLKDRTWLYRRNWPVDVALVIGSRAMKQSLKTGNAATARVRAAEVNASFERVVSEVRERAEDALSATEVSIGHPEWQVASQTALQHLRATLEPSEASVVYRRERQVERVPSSQLARAYLEKRSRELRHGGFKSVRYSVELFASKYGELEVTELTRAEGREFLELVAQLSPTVGRSVEARGLSLDQLVVKSSSVKARITARTQRRIWAQVNHWLDWCVYEGHLEANPFRSVRFDQKVRSNPYAVPTDAEVVRLLGAYEPVLRPLLLICLLSGMRAGEAAGLLREDLVLKGRQGLFFHVRPNTVRLLKTSTAERLVPVHPELVPVLAELPKTGQLFPDLSVNCVTKRFMELRRQSQLERPGLVFHSTRKWFVTQCERAGVPEHWTASLVGHQSARSENGLTYGIYSAGISDQQKRSIIDQIKLPT